MARILIDGMWFNEVAISSLYESEYEILFKQQAEKLFPDYFVVDFKQLIFSPEGDGKPDLAIIDRNYTNWWVVEVEKSTHSLESHVLKQIRIFSSAEYNIDVAKSLKQHNDELDFDKLTYMMRGQQPKVLVVVDNPKPEWISSFRRYEALLCVFQIFRSRRDKHIYRINGQVPTSAIDPYSDCKFDRVLSRYLIVSSPALLTVQNQDKFYIGFQDTISLWKRLDIQNKVYLVPVSQNPLQLKKKYRLFRTSDNSYYIKENL